MKENNTIIVQEFDSDRFGLNDIDFTMRVPEKSEIFSNEEARTYIEGCDYPESVDDLLLAWEIKNRFNKLDDMMVLDAMCGPGRLGRELLHLGVNSVTFHDGHEMMLDHAQEKALPAIQKRQKVDGILSEVSAIPIPDNSFDLVVCHNSIHQLSSCEKLGDVMKEFLRITKPGGFIIIADYQRENSASFKSALEKRLNQTRADIVDLLKPTFTAAFSKDEFADAIKSLVGVQDWTVIDAQPPILTRRMAMRVNEDPVKGHLMDFSKISQRVIVQKQLV